MYFGPFHFRQADRTLWRGSVRLHLTAKARDLLACLVSAQGRFVSKAEIMHAVWPDIHVLPDNIKVLIHEIRSVLDEDARHPHFIRSETGSGYAFVRDGRANPVPGDTGQGLFLNRTRELALLGEAFEDVRAGSSRVVFIDGERGIGKSALSEVFVRLASAGASLRTVRVRCHETAGEPQPLAPLIEVLQRLEEQRLSVQPLQSDELAPAWRAVPQASLPVQDSIVASLLAEMRAMLSAFARELPLILVLEDLQYADRATQRILGQLARVETEGRWLLLGTMCSEFGGHGSASLQRLTRGAPPGRVLRLEPLTAAQMERYLDARFGPDRLAGLTPALHAITGGNPSMIVAAIEGLIHSGALKAPGADVPAEVDVQAIMDVLPHVLRDAMSRKLDRLDRDVRVLLEGAALSRGPVTASAVAAVTGKDVGQVDRVLAALARRRYVLCRSIEGAALRLLPDGVYRFQHPMYARLLAERASARVRFRAMQRMARPRDRGTRLEHGSAAG